MDEVKQTLGEMRRSRMLVGSNRSKRTIGEPVAEGAFGNAIAPCNFAQRLASRDCRNGFGAQFRRVRHAASHAWVSVSSDSTSLPKSCHSSTLRAWRGVVLSRTRMAASWAARQGQRTPQIAQK